jgi:hypothetical protein
MNHTWPAVILMLVLGIAVIILGPILTIWALNTLFPALAIPYTLETWFAVILLKGFVAVTVNKNKG